MEYWTASSGDGPDWNTPSLAPPPPQGFILLGLLSVYNYKIIKIVALLVPFQQKVAQDFHLEKGNSDIYVEVTIRAAVMILAQN